MLQRGLSVGAENGTRTRDPNLGKVVLYQLSYFRKKCEEEETRTPTSQLTLPPQSSASTNSATSPMKMSESGKRDSNSRPQPWQGCALPTELFPRCLGLQIYALFLKAQNKKQYFFKTFQIMSHNTVSNSLKKRTSFSK